MAHWISPISLSGSLVTLQPLQISDRDSLLQAASDGDLAKLWYTGVPGKDSIDLYIENALTQQKNQGELAFTIRSKATGEVIGCTRFCNVDNYSHRVEIGYTWYAKSVQRSGVNTEAKYLLLQHAFENLNAIAVEFKTHWLNHQSRNAILRLGAKQDGILRNHKRLPDGSLRDTVVFSIIASEWLAVRNHLRFKLSFTG